MSNELEPGFTRDANVPGQEKSRESKSKLDLWLEKQDPKPAWVRAYQELVSERSEKNTPRWDWRKALYIAWACLPRSKRNPATEQDLVDLLGLANTATIRKWKANDPEINQRIQEMPRLMVLDAVGDVMEALVHVAKTQNPQAHPDRKLFLEIAGVYVPRSKQEHMGEDGDPIESKTVIEIVYGDTQNNSASATKTPRRADDGGGRGKAL